MKISVLLSKLDNERSAGSQLLEARGLDYVWLNAGEESFLDGRTLPNYEAAKKLLMKHINNPNSKIATYLDGDPDGFCSSSILFQWIRNRFGRKIDYIVPEGKVHGIIESLIPEDLDLLIMPDASSSEGEIHKKLIEKGTEVLVLDHHEINLENGEFAVIVNPHHPKSKYENKGLSGTGVVYKFIEAMDKEDDVDYHTNFLDLVAIATVADVMTMKTHENKALINKGCEKLVNPYFVEYMKATQRVSDKPINPTLFGFYLVPPINALIRVGTQEDKVQLFEAMSGLAAPQTVVALVNRLKSKQDRGNDPIITRIALNLQGKDSHNVIFTAIPTSAKKSTTGLIAGKIASAYKRPTFLYRVDSDNLATGSARNVNNSPVAALKDFCEESGLFEWVAGHQGAFGYAIKQENIPKFVEYADQNLPEYEPVFFVDFDISSEEEKGRIISELFELADHFGTDFPEALVVDKIAVNPSNISLRGANKNTLIIQKGQLEYISFGFKGELPIGTSYWTIVGKPSVNTYNGISTPQIKMEAWEIEAIDL